MPMGRVYKALVKAGRITEQFQQPEGAVFGDAIGPDFFDERDDPFIKESGSTRNSQPASSRREARASAAASNLRVGEFARNNQGFVEPRQSFSIHDLRVDQHLAGLIERDDLARERYNTLAVRLINLAAKHNRRSLLVTSALEGEGKTTIATNLAWVMARQSGKKVLLLDADLRRPSICKMLGLKSPHGLVDVIERRAAVSDSIVAIKPHGMYVLANRSNGDIPNLSAGDILTTSRVEGVLDELESAFDFVVIDAPPITDFADAQRLAALADGTVLVVKAGRTHYSAVGNALKLIPKERRVGVVLNVAEVFNEEVTYYYGAKNKRRGWFGKKH